MKRFIQLFVTVCLLSGSLYAEEILLVTGEWYPYTTESSAKKGAFTEVVTAVLTEMKVDFKIEFYPWKRAEMMVKQGVAWAAFPYKITDERKTVFNFSDQIMNGTGRFFYYKPDKSLHIADWSSYSDLKSYKIGGVLGYWYEKEFKKAGLNVIYSPSDELNFKNLQKGQVNLAASDELVGRTIIQKYFPEQQEDFAVLPRVTDVSSLHLMIGRHYKDSQRLTEQFNRHLSKLKESGQYTRIMNRYGIRE